MYHRKSYMFYTTNNFRLMTHTHLVYIVWIYTLSIFNMPPSQNLDNNKNKKQTNKQTNTQTNRQTNKQTNKQTKNLPPPRTVYSFIYILNFLTKRKYNFLRLYLLQVIKYRCRVYIVRTHQHFWTYSIYILYKFIGNFHLPITFHHPVYPGVI